MATVKDIAKQAGVSATTVSIIMNGRGAERNISPATCKRVREAARLLGYQPDLNARRLRSGHTPKPMVALFWPLDYRLQILSSLINGITKELHAQNVECELVIQTFEDDHLDEYTGGLEENIYSAVFVGACSSNDLQYLETLNLSIPVILINRDSGRYSSVGVDNLWVGRKAAELVAGKGYTESLLVVAEQRFLQTRRRTNAFLEVAAELGIQIPPEYIFSVDGNMAGGADAAVRYLSLKRKPKIMFCESDVLALGAIHSFLRLGVKIPDQLEIFAVSMLGGQETLYCVPSLSVIEIPNEKIAAQAVRLMLDMMKNGIAEPVHQVIACEMIPRDSFQFLLQR